MKKVLAFLVVLVLALSGCGRYTCLAPGESHNWDRFGYEVREDFTYHSPSWGDFEIVLIYEHADDSLHGLSHGAIGLALDEVLDHFVAVGGDPASIDGAREITILVADLDLTNDLCHTEGDGIAGCSCAFGELFPNVRDYENHIAYRHDMDEVQTRITFQHEMIHILLWMNGYPDPGHTMTQIWEGYE